MRAMAETVTIGVLDYAGAQRAAVYGLVDLFTWAARLHERRTGASGLEVSRFEQAALDEPDTPLTAVVLPPSLGESPPGPIDEAVGAWLLRRHEAGTMLCSVCVGAFLLADIGLLDGRPATTHWALDEAFGQRYPEVELDCDRLLVDDGDVITAGGLFAWIDLGLCLVERTLGPATMLETARFFLVDPGGREQRFYRTFTPTLTHGDAQILKVQRWLQRNVGKPVNVAKMAKRAGLGERTFMRRFQRATGLRTREYLQHLRVGKARERLELSQDSLQEIAWAVGYEDAGALRKVFAELVGLTPAEYRRRLGGRAR
ncbi:transcriptional regulator, AraC family protein [Plesiocystis pacifica SIR-1]|uniref:Transcriptional regulator, AraC family protein n=1 Tax=Plesiocystis pacifica SIR-1 TaxID=391625 RepID=A6G0H7_9BACT|nr:helix-turn-helix domain-containing protein [Plesiocystis pacifica]EDM80623.1 transcriptional regulator, AraC family protein [Plesiocystis pacifica SIR-1]